MRRLELENSCLQQQVSSIEETNTREVTSVRTMYDKELSQVKHDNDIAILLRLTLTSY